MLDHASPVAELFGRYATTPPRPLDPCRGAGAGGGAQDPIVPRSMSSIMPLGGFRGGGHHYHQRSSAPMPLGGVGVGSGVASVGAWCGDVRQRSSATPLGGGATRRMSGMRGETLKVITCEGWLRFCRSEQGEAKGPAATAAATRVFEAAAWRPFEGAPLCLTLLGFERLLLDAAVNDAADPAILESEAVDWSLPLPSYFIASSHNTYIVGNQLTGRSDAAMYRRVLLEGCRCLEIDLWDGADGEPEVTHGGTLVTRIRLQAVMEAIAESAFVVSRSQSSSLEMHCTSSQQEMRRDHMRGAGRSAHHAGRGRRHRRGEGAALKAHRARHRQGGRTSRIAPRSPGRHDVVGMAGAVALYPRPLAGSAAPSGRDRARTRVCVMLRL